MTSTRFPWQLQKANDAVNAKPDKKVLNVGANNDPAGLRARFPANVVNCDLEHADSRLGYENHIDVQFNCAYDTWPFDDNSASLVIMGDIIEHLFPSELDFALREANRVADFIAITVPEDPRFLTDKEEFELYQDGPKKEDQGRTHCALVTEEYLREHLAANGWVVTEWQTVDYYFVPRGFFVLAARA